MLNRRKRRIIKRLIKRTLIIGVPIGIFCALFYISITSLSHASESTFSPEKYYEDASYSDNNTEYDNTDQVISGENMEDSSATGEGESEIITNHDNVILDTDPDSITVLVNKELSLPTEYVPSDLEVPDVKFSFSYYDEKKLLRKVAADALEELFEAAEEEDLSLYGVSGYRSYERQYDIFTNNIKKQGLVHTMKYSAKPGYSEHQTGLSIDISTKSINNRLDSSFENTNEGIWVEENAHLYGYIVRYAKDKTAITGYSYEPWHIRYVGKSLALYLYENNLCLEEYYGFEPSIDYSNEISYDNLEDFGIDLEDVIEPTKAPTKVPTPTPTPTPEEVEKEEEKDTEEDGKGASKPTVSVTPVNEGNAQEGSGNTPDSNTEEGTGNEDQTEEGNGTITPTPPVEDNDDNPVTGVTPGVTPIVTPSPTPNNGIINP